MGEKSAESHAATGMRLLREGRHAEAERAFREALDADEQDADAHNQLGCLLHARREFRDAVEHFRKALAARPDFADAHNNLGKSLNNLRDLRGAQQAFNRAVELAPNFANAQNNLGHVLRAQGRLEEAVGCFRSALEIDPSYVAAHLNLGTGCSLLGDYEQAAECFSTCLTLDPDNRQARINLGTVRQTQGDLNEAARLYREVIDRQPDDAEAHFNLGVALAELRQPEDAEVALREAIRLAPDNPDGYAQLASLLEELNRLEESERVARAGLVLDAENPVLNLAMARCERRAGDLHAARQRLERFALDRIDERARRQFHFELGLIRDRLGNYEAAWEDFKRANAIGSAGIRAQKVDKTRYLDRVDHIREFFENESPAAWPTLDLQSVPRPPVFLFGFNRSGTTLVELALDAHPGLETIEEQPTLNAVEGALEQLPGGYPAALRKLHTIEATDLRALYFEQARKYTSGDATKCVVDKLPLRTIHAGLIWRLFPEARIVLTVRHPYDVCLSNFMQQYEPTDTMANFDTLEHTAVAYDRVMSLWSIYVDKLDMNYHMLRYEDLVEDIEGELRKLLAYVGVDWDERVMDYQSRAAKRRQINTNSYYQVTQPLYRDSVYRWRHYARHFDSVKQILEPHVRRFGYDT
jgi:tetratricopeptide (TPR) repeat protein